MQHFFPNVGEFSKPNPNHERNRGPAPQRRLENSRGQLNRKNEVGNSGGGRRGSRRGRTEVGLEEPLRVLLHVAAVDGRHGWRPTGRRPAPTLPRPRLGFWRSRPAGLREPPAPRRRGRRRMWDKRAPFPRRERSSLFWNGGVERTGARERAEGLEGDGEEDEGGSVVYTRRRGAVLDGLVPVGSSPLKSTTGRWVRAITKGRIVFFFTFAFGPPVMSFCKSAVYLYRWTDFERFRFDHGSPPSLENCRRQVGAPELWVKKQFGLFHDDSYSVYSTVAFHLKQKHGLLPHPPAMESPPTASDKILMPQIIAPDAPPPNH
jgi:hypothetical protein